MANLFVAVVTVGVLLAAMSGLMESSVAPQSAVSDSLKSALERNGRIARTVMSSLGTTVDPTGTEIELTVKNDGQTELRGFSDWDLLITYEGTTGQQIQRLIYTSSSTPSAGEWTVEGIYLDAGSSTPEEYQPGIADPEEEFTVKAVVSPAVTSPSDNSIVLVADNGVKLTTTFIN